MTEVDNGLPKSTRITQKSHFDYLFSSGRRAENLIVRIQYGAPYLQGPMVAFVATKRQGNAPQRNLSKRLLRELYRLHDPKPPVDMVLIAKPALLKCSFSKLKTEFSTLMETISQGLHEWDHAPLHQVVTDQDTVVEDHPDIQNG